jgi:hypothetical protein
MDLIKELVSDDHNSVKVLIFLFCALLFFICGLDVGILFSFAMIALFYTLRTRGNAKTLGHSLGIVISFFFPIGLFCICLVLIFQ